MQWTAEALVPRFSKKSPPALVHESFVTASVKEMLGAGAISLFLERERSEVVSPLGVVPKGSEGKFKLIISMRYVNEHLVKRKFKFEGLKDLADMA